MSNSINSFNLKFSSSNKENINNKKEEDKEIEEYLKVKSEIISVESRIKKLETIKMRKLAKVKL